MAENIEIASRIRHIPAIPVSTDMISVLDYFFDNLSESYFPVIDESQSPVGLIRSQTINKFAYQKFGRGLLANPSYRNALEKFTSGCPVASIDTTTEKILSREFLADVVDGVIITKDGQYAGFLDQPAIRELFHHHEMVLVEKHNTELESRNTQLKQALNDLKQSQQQLVESEKMAALGHLIAGVAHEINTPLGVVRASISNIMKSIDATLEALPETLKNLEGEQLALFLKLVKKEIPLLTAREERKYRRQIIRLLEDQEIENADSIADTLVDLGVTEDVDDFLPLTTSDLILQTAYDLSSLKRNAMSIESAVERSAKIVFALKKFAHRDHSGERIEADLIDSLETALTLYTNQLKHGIEVVKNFVQIPLVWCYPDELNQVWSNLIHNAVQAMKNKGTLEIAVSPHNEKVLISITDSGPGIPQEIQPKIFNPFFTTKPAGEGSGLGLDICKRIIDKHFGEIGFNSAPGKTEFWILLPIKP